MDPNTPETLPPLSESGSENLEPSSTPSETPSPSTAESDDSAKSGNDSATSPTSPDETEGDVNDDEVGVVELAEDVPHEEGSQSRNVTVTCQKCSHKNDTVVFRKQFDDQMDERGNQPMFKTKCKFCNHVTTYVLTGSGTSTVA